MLLQQRPAFNSTGACEKINTQQLSLESRHSACAVQALVSSGNVSPEDFTSSDVLPSELCSLPVPLRLKNATIMSVKIRKCIVILLDNVAFFLMSESMKNGLVFSFEGKTYMQLFQYLISKRSVILCMILETLAGILFPSGRAPSQFINIFFESSAPSTSKSETE